MPDEQQSQSSAANGSTPPPLNQAAGGATPPPPPPPAMYGQPVPGDYHPCPRCGSPYVGKVSFSWWGGLLGPRLFCHCKCQACGATFNGKTGKSNTTAIAVYLTVATVIALLIVFLLLVSAFHQ